MRLFLALDLPDDVKRRLSARCDERKASLPKARWVRPETLHLTLAFLGGVDEALVPEIDQALGPVFAARPAFTARLGGVGAFPPRGKARVLWTEFEAVRPADFDLAGLHGAAESALAGIGAGDEPLYRPESRRFHPHVTLARCRDPWPHWALSKWAEGFGDAALTFPVSRGTLFESHLTPAGARYRAVSTYPFAG